MDPLALRRVALAVSVLDDIDLVPRDDGIMLTGVSGGRGGRGTESIEVSWLELRRALVGADPESDLGRTRVSAWLSGRRIAAQRPAEELQALARPIGLPVGHGCHPGGGWVRRRVLGGALDLGFGFVGVGPDPDAVVVIPPGALDAAGVDPTLWWPAAEAYLDQVGTVAAHRLADSTDLRPIGDCDVVTLLGSTVLRRRLCLADATGMRAAAVPMRRRGWLDLRHIDPAFTVSAAAVTDAAERGFDRPLLLTVDEVTLAPSGGRPAEIVLRDRAAAQTAPARTMRG